MRSGLKQITSSRVLPLRWYSLALGIFIRNPIGTTLVAILGHIGIADLEPLSRIHLPRFWGAGPANAPIKERKDRN